MKEKILKALKTKYANMGFGANAFDGVAEYLSTTITEDDQIETGISGVENLLKVFQSEVDSRVNSAVERAKKEQQKNQGGQQQQQQQPNNQNQNQNSGAADGNQNDDTPAWAKALIESNKNLSDKIAALEGEKITKTRHQALSEKLKNAPELFKNRMLKDFNRMKFESDEDFNTYITEVEEEVKEAVQQSAEDDLSGFAKPAQGKGGKNQKEASKEEVDAVVNLIV